MRYILHFMWAEGSCLHFSTGKECSKSAPTCPSTSQGFMALLQFHPWNVDTFPTFSQNLPFGSSLTSVLGLRTWGDEQNPCSVTRECLPHIHIDWSTYLYSPLLWIQSKIIWPFVPLQLRNFHSSLRLQIKFALRLWSEPMQSKGQCMNLSSKLVFSFCSQATVGIHRIQTMSLVTGLQRGKSNCVINKKL